MKLSSLKPNPTNPRIVKGEKFEKLVQSVMTAQIANQIKTQWFS